MSKTFLITCSFAPSLVNFRGRLLEQVRANGHSVFAAAPDFDDATRSWCRERGITTVDVSLGNQSLNPFSDLRTCANLYRMIKAIRPDAVMGYTHKPAIYTAITGALARVPHVAMMVTGLGLGFESDTFRKRLVRKQVKALFWLACRCSAVVIFHNKDNRDFFLSERLLPASKKNTVVGGSGIDLSHFSKVKLRSRSCNELSFLLIARIVRYKGILEYAQAVRELSKEFPHARFVVAGYRDNNPDSYSDDEWRQIEENLEYIGKLDDVRSAIADCDVFVLPSYGEGLPRTVLEAMAMGRAVITTDTPGCRDTVDEGVNGHLVAPRDSQSLRDAMRRFLTGQSDHRSMAEKSLEKVKFFDVRKVNADMVSALNL